MRLTLQLLGLELDITLGQATEAEPETKQGPGDSLSIPIGFTASVAPEWDAPGSYHQFDPEPESEDRRRWP